MNRVAPGLILASVLSSCVTADTGTIGSVQSQTAALCRFIPTAKTISSLLSVRLGSVAAIAEAICKAVAEPMAEEAGAPAPEISGIAIEGYFVQR